MKPWILIFVLALIFQNCNQNGQIDPNRQTHPNSEYHFCKIDTSELNYFETIYLPVYPNIYHIDGTSSFSLTTTISSRNTSPTDTIFLTNAVLYNSKGNKISQYIDQPIQINPRESIEFVVAEAKTQIGAGYSFIIDWTTRHNKNQMLFQSIMIGTYGQQGISFLSEARVIKSRERQ